MNNIDALKKLKNKLIILEEETREKLSIINNDINELEVVHEWNDNSSIKFNDDFHYLNNQFRVTLDELNDDLIPYLQRQIIRLDEDL